MPVQTTISPLSKHSLTQKISNVSQVGGIETSVMDNGYARGTRIAWINTGSGLRYKVVLDRAMDIADAFYNQHSLAWLSVAGVMPYQMFTGNSAGWLRTFAGGLLTTCGLTHVGGPEKDEFGERGLHGLISNSPAEIESVIQPDPLNDQMEMSITGKIKEAVIFGPVLELKRTIRSRLGETWIEVHDEITNKGNTTSPHMLLYHVNLGWPLVDEGAEMFFDGAMHYINEARDRHIFNKENNYRICPAPMQEHAGSGEAAACFDIPADEEGNSVCGIFNSHIGLGLQLKFSKQQLPWMTNWQHWGIGEYVTGLEPGTHPPVGQAAARKNNNLIFIEPGETKKYNVRFTVTGNSKKATQSRH